MTENNLVKDAESLRQNSKYVTGYKVTDTHDNSFSVSVQVSKNATMEYTIQIIQMMNTFGRLHETIRHTNMDFHELVFLSK